MNTPIHIACNIDANYIQHSVVMFTSLCENNKEADFVFHIITGKLPQSAENEIKKISEKYAVQIKFYYPEDEILKNCPPPGSAHISYASYYRCFLTVILPEDIHKILYLDCDMVIRGDIRELWETDISSYAVGCVEDMWSQNEDNYIRLHYPATYSYFNSGVLLINLDYWRENNLHLKVNQYLNQNYKNLRFNDQDVLNALFYNKKLSLPFRWNMQDGFFRRKRKISPAVWDELDEAMKNPVILHYTGGKKPWHYKSVHPYKSEYFKYLDLTSWAHWRPKTDYKFLLINSFNHFLYFTGIVKPKYRKIKR